MHVSALIFMGCLSIFFDSFLHQLIDSRTIMKRFSPIIVLLFAGFYFSITGFQCGSAELTTAKLAMQQKQWEKAEESLVKELAKNQQNEEAWYLLGQVRLEMKNYQGMNEAYSKALALSDDHKKEIGNNRLAIWANLYNDGIAAYNKGRDNPSNFDKAIQSFETAILLIPDSITTYYVLALAHYAKKDYDGAEPNLKTALAKKPDNAEAADLLGQIHVVRATKKTLTKDTLGATAEYVEAAAAFEKAYKADPQNSEYIFSLIEAYDKADQSDKAMALTRDAVASDPNNRTYRYAYGVFLLKQDKFEEGIEQFGRVVNPAPDSIDGLYMDATYNLGVSYLNWGVALKKESDMKAEADREKKGRNAIVDLSYKEKFRAALPYLEKSTELREEDATLWQQLGRLYANLNMVEKSKQAFAKADQIMSNN
jgi:cytochrome c-type biogenesis protein CcmH/NrfG